MFHEIESFTSREPVIHPSELRLKDGGFANKMTLQQAASNAGLPVSPILDEAQAKEFLSEGKQKEKEDIDSYYRLRLDDAYRVHIRGYFEKPDEMWWVDTIPTTSILDSESIEYYRQTLRQKMQKDGANMFLQRNFGQMTQGSEKFFLQRNTRASIYFSTLTVGPYLFIAGNNEFGRGVNWKSYYDGNRVGGDWHFSPPVDHAIRQLSQSASDVLDKSLTHKRSAFDFKHDILWDTGKNSFTLIQSRVSSRKLSDNDLAQQHESVMKYLSDGAALISLEPSEVGELTTGHVTERLYVLKLTNDMHRGVSSTEDFNAVDLTRMVGLIVPQYLRGGLLHHGGYRFLAYAQYWGLPISFSA